MKRLAFPALLVLALSVTACAGHNAGTSVVPQGRTSSGAQSQSTTASSATISGTIDAVFSSTEFQVQGGSGCGYVDVFTSSSTTFSPAGATPAVGDYSVNTGTGSCATNLQASSVTLSTPSPSPSSSPTPLPASYAIGHGEIFGYDNQFSPNDGDTSTGGQGQTVENVPCLTSMPGTYHVHAFLGIIVNGKQLALPDGIGLVKPGSDGTFDGIPNWTEYASQCYYETHTHDASGAIHLESSSSAPWTSSIFTLGQVLHVWGMSVTSSNIGPYKGTVRAYVAQVPFKTETVPNTDYTLYSGDPNAIPLYSHTCVWLEVGPTYVPTSSLPALNWWLEY